MGAEIHEFSKKVKGNFYLPSQGFQIWRFLTGMEVATNAKFQLNISKIILARPKNSRAWV